MGKEKQHNELIDKKNELEKKYRLTNNSLENGLKRIKKEFVNPEEVENVLNNVSSFITNLESFTTNSNKISSCIVANDIKNSYENIKEFSNVLNDVFNINLDVNSKIIINSLESISEKNLEELNKSYLYIDTMTWWDKIFFKRKHFKQYIANLTLKYGVKDISNTIIFNTINSIKKIIEKQKNFNYEINLFKIDIEKGSLKYVNDYDIKCDLRLIYKHNSDFFKDLELVDIEKDEDIKNILNKLYEYKNKLVDLDDKYELLLLKYPVGDIFNELNTIKKTLIKSDVTKKILEKEVFELAEHDYRFLKIKNEIETNVSKYLAYKLDKNAIKYYNDYKKQNKLTSTRKSLKEKMDIENFQKLLKYFPCIIGSLRDYAEIVPLHKGLFDLIIIDEASQVSIAQAFPALIRAKKVLILGDKKQFSNVKSSMAGNNDNKKFLSNIKNDFKKSDCFNKDNIRQLEIFNIKKSVMDFFEENNPDFEVMLKTHFRGYPELISYSNKYFYNDELQALKIRDKSKSDIIKFHRVNYKQSIGEFKNTNISEIDYIIKELENIITLNITDSVGIITPHSEQAKAFKRKISQHCDKDLFFDSNGMDLKVMTFDSCQGEERDIIYYSMVANETEDKLKYIFLKEFKGLCFENDEEKSVRAQRLNVGFSRCKESLNFVISKDINEYNGSIGVAMNHFYDILHEKDEDYQIIDENSPMERKIKSYIEQSIFFKQNKDKISLKCQFPIGRYLKQIDSMYNQGNYVVDFLLSYEDIKIVIEYDGFEYHYEKDGSSNEFSLKSDDLYRQNILESYGYPFIRLNKFNISGNDSENINIIEEKIKNILGV